MSPSVCALPNLLHEAGFTWAAADEVAAALDRLRLVGCSADDVASAVERLCRKRVAHRLRVARQSVKHLLDKRHDLGNSTKDKKNGGHPQDVTGQQVLWQDIQEPGGFTDEAAQADEARAVELHDLIASQHADAAIDSGLQLTKQQWRKVSVK